MNIEVKNISDSDITLFIRKGEVDKRITIAPGSFILADDYETKTMMIFKRKNLITTKPAQLFEFEPNYLLSKEVINTISDVDPNHDEVMDDFHTTETHEAILVDKDMKYFQENLMKSLTREENPTRFDIVEGEVEQYVEDGYIKGEWTDDDVAFLRKNYPVKGRKYCSVELNRNESSVQKKINSLGLKKKKKKKKK